MTSRFEISSITDDQIRFFMAAKMINAEADRALHKIMAQKDGIAAMDTIWPRTSRNSRASLKISSGSAKT